MKLDDLYPLVLPFVPELPLPTVDQHIKLAAQEFYRRSHAWRETLDPITLVADQSDYDVDSPVSGARIEKLLSARVDDAEYAKAVAIYDGIMSFLDDTAPATGELVVTVAMAPVITGSSWTLPAKLDEHAHDISLGALASLYTVIPGKGEQAMVMAGRFNDRIQAVGIKTQRGKARQRLGSGSAAQFF